MTVHSTAARPRKLPIWVRLLASVIASLGTFCLAYHLVFWFLWRFLFGEEVWPWPPWSLWILVVLPSIVALAAAVFLLFAKLTKRNRWISVGIGILSVYGLLRYGAEVWKVMFQLGFRP